MPQMSPLLWAPLFVMTISMLIFSMVKLFFLKLNSTTQNKMIKTKETLIPWLW